MSQLPAVFVDPEDSQLAADAKKQIPENQDFSYTERDVIIYNLGIGATEQELQWTYEGDEQFRPLPTFGILPMIAASSCISFEWLPNFDPSRILQGEHYLSIKASTIPTEANLVSETRLVEVLDKGKAAALTNIVQTRNKATGELIFENQATFYFRGQGGFGGKRIGSDRGPATAANVPPPRAPDAVMEEKMSSTQAALYRLSGDYTPFHISPEIAKFGGFDKPFLHGHCSMGFAGKHVLKTFGAFKDIKVRFANIVYPGETLVTDMWKEGNKVIFTTRVKERGTIVLANAAVTLADDNRAKL